MDTSEKIALIVFHSIEAAVATFAQARPPGIYKGDYLKELYRRYGDIEEAPPHPYCQIGVLRMMMKMRMKMEKRTQNRGQVLPLVKGEKNG